MKTISRRGFLLNLRTLPGDLMWDDRAPPETFDEVKERVRLLQLLLEGCYDALYRMNERVRWLEKQFHRTGPYFPERSKKI